MFTDRKSIECPYCKKNTWLKIPEDHLFIRLEDRIIKGCIHYVTANFLNNSELAFYFCETKVVLINNE